VYWSVEMPFARVNGIELYYERHGEEGDALVFVHGYTGDVTDWRHQISEFAPDHRVLVLDHRGHGRSHAPADRGVYEVEHMVDDVEALAAHAGFERYHLVGHSMGGAVAQEVALRSGGRLLTLTLEDTGPGFGFRGSGVMAKFTEMRNQIADAQGMEAVAAMPSMVQPPPHTTLERREEERVRLSRMSPDGFVGASLGLNRWPGTKDRLGKIAVPTLVVCGELDTFLLSGSRYLAQHIPGATLELIPEAAHSPQFERPGLFNAAVRRHIEAHR
jgi:pimeloyl-ACP methyl ester carboxylesterase